MEELAVAKGNVALVTGANKGIGYEIARQLGERGFHVFVGARNADAGSQAVVSLEKGGASVEFVEIDVSDQASTQAAAKIVATKTDHLDVLVNNAGVMEDETGIAELSDSKIG